MKRQLTAVSIVILVVVSVVSGARFVLRFEENLHCTQWTSFHIAAFELGPHGEELEHGLPLVYCAGLAAPLRAYLGASIVTLLFIPSFGALVVLLGRLSYRRWRGISTIATLIVLANSLLPNIIVGERFTALGAFALLRTVPLLLIVGLLLRAYGQVKLTGSAFASTFVAHKSWRAWLIDGETQVDRVFTFGEVSYLRDPFKQIDYLVAPYAYDHSTPSPEIEKGDSALFAALLFKF